MHYELNYDACTCFIVWDVNVNLDCNDYAPDIMVNPFSKSKNKAEKYCITEEEYNSIFDHTLGPDCIEGTEDDTNG